MQDTQRGALDKDLRSPYTERWSLGIQRELLSGILLDGSYVGSESHKLTTWEQVNPKQADGSRLYPNFGVRRIRTSHGNSSYHSMQWRVERRFGRQFQAAASYTWSRNIDSVSEGVGIGSSQSSLAASASAAERGWRLDRGPSDYDRPHRLTIYYTWSVPAPTSGFWRLPLSGWSISGITTFQSGAPFTVLNGSDRNGDGTAGDRPDISNPKAPLNTRAIHTLLGVCSTGYLNPDSGSCVSPGDVHWIEGVGPPNASTVGRNTLHAGSINNFDVSVSRSFRIGENHKLEFRGEAFNVFNHPQYSQIPDSRTVFDSATVPQPGVASRFLNRDFTDSGTRSV